MNKNRLFRLVPVTKGNNWNALWKRLCCYQSRFVPEVVDERIRNAGIPS